MALSSDYDYEYTIFHNHSHVNMVENHSELSALQIYAAVCATIIFCISMPGNSFLLQVLVKERAWMATSDILLLQFTVSNLCFVATLPFLACNALHGWIFGEWACGAMRGLTVLGLNSSVMILTAIAVHSYVTVVQTSCLSALYSSKFRVVVTSIIVWLVCAPVSIRLAVNSHVVNLGYIDLEVCVFVIDSMILVMFVEIWLFFFIPFFVIGVCYVHMRITIKQPGTNNSLQPSKLISRLIVVFFLCLAPCNIAFFVEVLVLVGAIEHNRDWRDGAHYADYIIFTLSHFYCCLNPLVHIFGAQRFRRHLPVLSFFSAESGDGNNNATSVPFRVLSNDV